MKSKKLMAASILSLVCTLATAGCGSSSSVAPDYSKYRDTNIMGISGWVAPIPGNWAGKGNKDLITDECYKALADCGLNKIYAIYEFLSCEDTARAAKLAGKYGVGYYARDTENIQGDPFEDELEPGDIRDRKYVQTYCNEPGFVGHLATDEPGASKFTQLGHLKEFYDTEFPGKEFYVNLFPCYALLSQIQTDTYEEYIQGFIDKVNPDFLSYDHYALEQDSYGHVRITSSVLYNHLVAAEKASAAGIPYGNFTQTLQFSNSSRHITKESEIRWQIMVDMAYGCSRVQYFTYCTPIEWSNPYQEGLVDVNGVPQDTYYFAQNVNNTIAAWDEAYLNFKWKGTMLVDGEDVSTNLAFDMVREESPKSIPGVKSAKSNLDTLIGQFDSKVDSNKGYMITNFAEPSKDSNVDKVSVTFENKSKALVYDKTDLKTVELKGGVLEYDINPGEGIFVIPF